MKERCSLLSISIIVSIGLMVVLQTIDMPLRSPAAPQGIVSFELAGSLSRATAIVQSWDRRAMAYAGFSLGLDYLFMLAYATAFMLSCRWAAEQWQATGWRRLGMTLATLMPVAALADVIENISLWRTLQHLTEPWPHLARVMAVSKFSLLALGLLYVLVSLFMRVLRRSAD